MSSLSLSESDVAGAATYSMIRYWFIMAGVVVLKKTDCFSIVADSEIVKCSHQNHCLNLSLQANTFFFIPPGPCLSYSI